MNDTWWVDLSELDDEQSDIIALPLQGNYLVVGPPGSGKTNLILLRASYLVDSQKPNVVVLMFTRSLRDFVAQGSGNYAVAEDKIQTIFRWEHSLLREHGVSVVRTDDFKRDRQTNANNLKGVFDKKPALERHMDCILVDETQDCLPEELELFFRAAKTVFFVGDDRQQVYEKNGLLETLSSRVSKRELTKHYRNGEAVCKVADAIGKNFGESALLGTCNYDERKAKSSASFESCKDENELVGKLASRLEQQLKAYPRELLGVACPTNEHVRRVREALEARVGLGSNILEDGDLFDPFNPDRTIYLCTMHEAKGLEFRTVHLAYAEHVKKMRDVQKRLAFTAVTRAKTSVAVYHIDSLPGYMEQARETVAARREPPSVRNLFKKRKA